ncbi:Na(+)/H(+) antiporter subunit B [Engelhardtia mirabilis]|uniref:Na(+)/H(+) antiporter subunit B n=1 Tax=Engelhardtia mirabilis TaxID=2528011 RepID=A0A518BF15_9BACT|nr:Na(+)/H(+) antiporter subunit B [Planctomycetes bacterium Pla133]QDU99902.1 Na(+)/H(+) antiporter subunit B [Planctomycetes bacterium Pla86]
MARWPEMESVILSRATRLMMPVLIVFSVFLLLRGHNAPGGGFVGGLIASTAFALLAISDSVDVARQTLRIEPRRVMGFGLLVALSAGLIGLLSGGSFFEGVWPGIKLPVIGKLGTPMLFDIGVFFVVVGFTLTVVFTLLTEED